MPPTGVSLLGLMLLVLACSGDTPVRPEPSGPPGPAPSVRVYLDTMLSVMQQRALYRRWIDWPRVRQDVLAAAGTAQRIEDAAAAIRTAITLLGDGHTAYVPRTGPSISVPTPACGAPPSPTPDIPVDVGYVRVDTFSGSGDAARRRATEIQQAIRAQDRPALSGWIVDLRGNLGGIRGGNLWPMLAGLGPLLGEGRIGSFADLDSEGVTWSYGGGIVRSNGLAELEVAAPYALHTPRARVAVLIDNAVAGAGEAAAIAFKARPETRFFGNGTCGRSVAIASLTLADSATLHLTVAVMADRAGHWYGDRVPPDEPFVDNGPAVARAIDWLRRGH